MGKKIFNLSMALILMSTVASTSVWGKSVFVANNGVDSPGCGEKNTPCRSISQGIEVVDEGGRVLVGAGRYGDLNGDGDFDDPGDEAGEIGYGCRCMVLIDKSVKVLSRHGPQSTVLDANEAMVDVVNITADNVVFGAKKRGFSLTGARADGADDGIGIAVTGVQNTIIEGNYVYGNEADALEIAGDGHRIRYNTAVANGGGFVIEPTDNGHIIAHNTAIANGKGHWFGNGFFITGRGHRIFKNTANANRGAGFLINTNDGSSIGFFRNDIIGNRGAGLWILGGGNMRVRKNNIFGNLGEEVWHQSEALNCGLFHGTNVRVDASWNYWGSANGPGPDPADNAGEDSKCGSGETIVVPFARKAIRPHGKRSYHSGFEDDQ